MRSLFEFNTNLNYNKSFLTRHTFFKTIKKIKSIKYNSYEAMEVRHELDFPQEMATALNHIADRNFGIEIDCDAIENMPSSAMSPSGFSVKQTRQFVHYFGQHPNASYLHFCEASPTKESETLVGKLITYLITDFMKSKTL